MPLSKIIDHSSIKPLRDEVWAYTHDILKEYLTEIDKFKVIPGYIGAKDVHDAVWGTICLNKAEVVIIDSPLLQRLRHIHHLGLAGLLFPGADYSRFEHTLGSIYIADKISRKVLEENPSIFSSGGLCPNLLCRFAAAFHDIGHLVCSHASEHFYNSERFSRYKEVKNAVRLFTDEDIKENLGFFELLSVLIVKSPSVERLIELAWTFSGRSQPTRGFKEVTDNLAALILGVPFTLRMLPFHSIISGPIDADKCDYLARDSYRTGVPVAVDIYRVIQKLKLIEGVPREWGQAWLDKKRPDPGESKLLGIALSAVKSVEEMLISRTLMYEKIYYHHKILAAEEMFRMALRLLDQCGLSDISNFRHVFKLSDGDLICNNPKRQLTAIVRETGLDLNLESLEFDSACSILKNLAQRNLVKRTCALFQIPDNNKTAISEASIEENRYRLNSLVDIPGGSANIDRFIRDIFEHSSLEKQDEFISRIVEEVNTILKSLGDNEIDPIKLKTLILPVTSPKVSSPSFNIPIECGKNLAYYNDIFQGELWDSSRKTAHRYHFIVGPAHIKVEVFLAVELVLFKDYQLILQNGAADLAKLDISDLEIKRESLLKSGYYDQYPALIPDHILLDNKELNAIPGIVKKFSSYEGPMGKSINDVSQITTFIKQFAPFAKDNKEKKNLFEGITRLLKSTTLLNRKRIVSSFKEMFDSVVSESGNEISSLFFTILGGAGDSSSFLSYYFNDLNKLFENVKISPKPINEVLNRNTSHNPIVFFDDAFYSGKQTIAIFQEMCGISEEERIIPESHNLSLNASQREVLKQSKIYLCYCYANEEKTSFIEKELRKLDLDATIKFKQAFPESMFASEAAEPFKSKSQKNLVKSVLSKIGETLLRSTKTTEVGFKKGWHEEKIKLSSLGYSNAQQAIVLGWNTPTYTLTPLWSKGKLENGTEWLPLFPRQSKSK